MGDRLAASGPLAPIRWWRWLLGVAVLGAGVPLLLAALLNVLVAGIDPADRFGSAVPGAFTIAAASTVPLVVLFAVVYRWLRKSRDRPTLVKIGAVIWGVAGGVASSIFGAEPGAVIVAFPLIALVGAAASYLFVLIVDGRSDRG